MFGLIEAAVLAHDMADGANVIGLSIAADDSRRAPIWLLANVAAASILRIDAAPRRGSRARLAY